MNEPPMQIQVVEPEPGLGTYYESPPGMFPIHMFYPGFEGLRLWFPALDAWVLEMLFDKLEKRFCRRHFRIMEIGTFAGGSAGILARHASVPLLCVDTWAGSGKDGDEMKPLYDQDVFEVFQRNAKLFPVPVATHKRTLNPDSLPDFLTETQEPFDLIFIDGGHDKESVKADYAVAKEWIEPGGIICGHDFTQFRGVTEAVLEEGLDGACGTVWWREMP